MTLTGRRVLVTGADGFIGSHLVEALLAQGAQVRALVWYNAMNLWGWLDSIDGIDDVEVVPGDIRDSGFCHHLCRDIDCVFHLAALIAVPFSYNAPESYLQTNVFGTLNLLRSAQSSGCTRFVHTSTSEVYGSARTVPITEQHPLQPQSPYSASKVAADAIAVSFYHSYDLPVTVARPFNTYGPRQSARAIIPTVILQLLAGKTTITLGSTHPTRDFLYVKDTVSGMIALANYDEAVGKTVNLGTGREISIADLTTAIARIAGADVDIQSDPSRVRPAASEVDRLVCDSSRAERLIRFKAKTNLEDGLSRTVDWFREPGVQALYKADVYNV